MNHVLIACSVLTCSIILSACGNDHHEDAHDAHDQSHTNHSDHSQAGSESTLEGMSLNDGNKWAMDEHTRSSFESMASSFLAADHSSMNHDALKALGSGLQQDITGLIKGCTMTGQAHDQLHIFLTGYMPAVNSLAEHGNIGDAEKVSEYLQHYDEFFE